MKRSAPLLVAAMLGLAVPRAMADQPSQDLIARGKYITTAADCQSCHTQTDGGTPFAGGRYMETPFGAIPSQNITPDKATGIGAWSDDDFYRALHDGIRKDGSYLFPVMPYTAYTKMTRDDVLAVKAYLFSLPPANAPAKPNKLPFPFNVRAAQAGWRVLYFKEGTFKPDPAKPAEYNRGAYLVEALEHCSMCHTARTALGGPSNATFEGGQVQGWYAPNLTNDVREGLGGWSENDIITYLKTGTAPGKGVAVGPMHEAVHMSLSHLTDDDLKAIAVYLKSVPAKETDSSARTASADASKQATSITYLTYCSSCHQPDGRGVAGQVPNLAGNLAVAAAGPETVYHAILSGLPASDSYARMPSFAGAMTNEEIADVTNYVRTAWGNTAPRNATLEGVATVRKEAPAYLAGVGKECPIPDVTTPAMRAASDPKSGVPAILASIDDATVFEKADQAIRAMRAASPQATNADIVNGLYQAECSVLVAKPDVPLPRKRWELNRLAQLVYVQLNPHKEAANVGAPTAQ